MTLLPFILQRDAQRLYTLNISVWNGISCSGIPDSGLPHTPIKRPFITSHTHNSEGIPLDFTFCFIPIAILTIKVDNVIKPQSCNRSMWIKTYQNFLHLYASYPHPKNPSIATGKIQSFLVYALLPLNTNLIPRIPGLFSVLLLVARHPQLGQIQQENSFSDSRGGKSNKNFHPDSSVSRKRWRSRIQKNLNEIHCTKRKDPRVLTCFLIQSWNMRTS